MNSRRHLWRRTLPLALLAAALSLAALKIYYSWPRPLAIEVNLPPELQPQEVFLQVDAEQKDKQPICRVILNPAGQRRLNHYLKLSPGAYLVSCRLQLENDSIFRQKPVLLESSATVHFDFAR